MSKNKMIVKRILAFGLAVMLTICGVMVSSADYVQAASKKKVASVSFSKDIVVLKKGKTYNLKTTVKPKNASNKNVSYKSSKKSVAQVNAKGKITAKKAGMTTITATAKDGSKKKASCKVYVYTKKIKKATVSPKTKNLKVGETVKLKTKVTSPKSGTANVFKWKSSNKNVAVVNENGKVTAKGAGTVTITGKAMDGSKKKVTCKITVEPEAAPVTSVLVTSVTLPASLEIIAGQSLKLEAVVAPANASNPSLGWTSSNPGIAAVDALGNVTAYQAGQANITAAAQDGSGKFAICAVTVKETEKGAWQDRITSPDGNIKASFKMDKQNGGLTYELYHGNELVVEPSPMGLVTSLGDFTSGLTYSETVSNENVKDDYTLMGAKKKDVSTIYNEKTFWFAKGGVSYGIAVRAYDDGIAFRYLVKKDGGGELRISAEHTGIGIPKDSSVTVYPYDLSNEGWPQTVEVSELESLMDDWGEPTTNFSLQMTYQLKDAETYVLASEADLQDTYCGAKLVGHATGMMDLRFCDEQEGDVVTTAPFESPWRYYVIGDLSDIALNTMAENLNPPCEIDTSWIQPGAMAWTWVNGDPCDDFETYKNYIDLAAEMGWQYLLLDEGWYVQENRVFVKYYDWTQDLIDYADEKNIGLVVWAHVKNLQTPEQQEKIQEWANMGFKGFKPDFFESASQDTVKLLNDLIKLAADNHMLIDPHGIYKPTGMRRTYPNLLTQEGVSASEGRSADSYYNCTMPFTRLAIGPADYAPLASFSNAEVDWIPGGVPDMYLNTTYAAMAAEAVLFESGLQCLADKPANYESSLAREFYINMPAEWDESVLVGGKIGEYVNMARKSGEDWYMGIMCNDPYEYGTDDYTQKRDKEFKLDFLEEGKIYTASIYEDGATKREITVRTQMVKKGDTITVSCLPYGGAAIKLSMPGAPVDASLLESLYDTKNIVQLAAAQAGNMVMEFNDGTEYYDIWWNWIDSSGGLQTAFRFRPVSSDSKEFRIQTAMRARDKRGPENKKVLTPVDDGANLALQDPDENDASQIWSLRKLENGNYIVVNKASAQVISLKNDDTTQGTEVCLKEFDDTNPYMQWSVMTREEDVPQVDPSVLLDKTMLSVGETAQIEIGEVELDEISVAYVSSDDRVATVDSNGTITAVKGGSATITTTVEFEGETFVFNNQIMVVGELGELAWKVTSPDNQIKVQFVLDEKKGSLCYAAYYGADLVVEPSPMGLVTNQGDFRDGLTFKSFSGVQPIEDSYQLIGARVKDVTANANEITVMFEKAGVSYGVVARAYDDGIAFRYLIEGSGELSISEENTGVKIPLGSEVTVADYDEANERIPSGKSFEELIGNYSLMMTYQLKDKDVYALVSEADLQGSYCVSMLAGHPSGMMDVRFCPKQQENGDVITTAPFQSPWRYMVIGNLGNIAVNTMAENLNPPCQIEDTSWIKPGAMAWSWVNGDPCDDFETYKNYVDLAAEMGWQYLLLDEGWYVQENRVFVRYYEWTQDLIDYANEKNIGLIVWAHKKNLETEEQQQKIKEWADMGFKGIKPDFFDSGAQDAVQLVNKLVEVAAENHMLIDPHGVYKPTGMRRTYPNALTQEGISASEGRMAYSSYNCTLPYTRLAIGPADYAPLASFSNAEHYGVDDRYLEASFAGLAAEAVLFESGMQCLADKPVNYANSAAKKFYMNMPAEWDESILVDGKIGKYVNMARRSGENWYMGIMCNDPFEYGTESYTQKRDKEFRLDFLEEGKTYTAEIYSDGAVKTEIVTSVQEVKKGDTITLSCLPYGGAAIKITPKQ